MVVVDSRKDPDLPEGWWNWGGIVRPVHLEAVGPAHLQDLGTMSQVRCRGPARALPRRAPARRHAASAGPAARSTPPSRCSCARRAAARSPAHSGSGSSPRRAGGCACRCPSRDRSCGRPSGRGSTRARITLRERGAVQQLIRRSIGMRSVNVKRGAPLPEQPPGAAARRLDPRGHAGPWRRAHRLGHGHDRERAEGPGRERDPRPLPHERPPALALRPGRDPGLERGPDLAARPAGPTSSGARRSATGRWSRSRGP